jgi:hypothetical protein
MGNVLKLRVQKLFFPVTKELLSSKKRVALKKTANK